MTAVILLEEKVLVKEKELLVAEESKISFRLEFTKLLEKRNHFETKFADMEERYQSKESQLKFAKLQASDRDKMIAEVLNIESESITMTQIEQVLKSTIADAKRH